MYFCPKIFKLIHNTKNHDNRDQPMHINYLKSMEPATLGTTKNCWKPPKKLSFCPKIFKFFQNTKNHDKRDQTIMHYYLNNMEPTKPGTTKNYWKPPNKCLFIQKCLNSSKIPKIMTLGSNQCIFTA